MNRLASLRYRVTSRGVQWIVGAIVLASAAWFGFRKPSRSLIASIVAGLGVVALLQRPILGLLSLVPAALIARMELGTGTEVALNPVTLLIPAMLVLYGLDLLRRQELRWAASRPNKPLASFLLANLFSLLIGNVLWDPAVPRPGNLLLVQLAQWALFAFSAGAYWLAANMVRDQRWLRRLTYLFLALGGALAILRVLPAVSAIAYRLSTVAHTRAPFWMLLAALAVGQLLFNRELSTGWRLFLILTTTAVAVYAFVLLRQALSNWLGVATVAGVLAWLRWPRLRVPVILVLIVLITSGILQDTVYEFAGGEAEWTESGGSRMTLIRRVLEVTMRNPITGLGPASYRAYAGIKPLPYQKALWLHPQISSHNNYVDLFSHGGLLGLGLFAWFAVELIRLGLRLRARFTVGFASGYVNGMLAAWAGALVLMLFADWILPFVYNIGFPGFQASVLVWLFLGGLVALEQMSPVGEGLTETQSLEQVSKAPNVH